MKENEGNIEVAEIEGILKEITFLRDSTHPESYTRIKEILNQIEMPFIKNSMAVGKRVFRCRIHQPGEDFFGKIDDITYRKDPHNITAFGRANEPQQSMFYCADKTFTSFSETSKVIRENISYDKEIVTVGAWEVQYPELNLINFIVSDFKNNAHERNPLIQRFINDFKESMNEMQFGEEWIRFMTYFSEEFMDDTLGLKHYKTTAAFSNCIYDFKGEDYHTGEIMETHGILYPSARYSSDGMNIVFKPEVIDNGWLKLVDVKRFTFTLVGSKDYEETECIDCLNIDHETGIINWNK